MPLPHVDGLPQSSPPPSDYEIITVSLWYQAKIQPLKLKSAEQGVNLALRRILAFVESGAV